jgi:tetratricopeptide (TPR) repeat protein
MATYNKRGYKKSKNAEVDVQAHEDSTTAEVFSTLDESAGKTEAWVSKNQNIILGVIAVVAIGVLGYLGYEQFVQQPKEASASNELFYPQQYFDQAVNATEGQQELYLKALQGADGKYSLIDIIQVYPGTKAANLANYEAGIAYFNLAQYQDAIRHLSAFSSDDVVLAALAQGTIGDAYVALKEYDSALSHYQAALNVNTNDFSTPKFLYKAGITALELGDQSKAASFFKQLKSDYEGTTEANLAQAYVGMLE